jgi:chaperonin GroES
MKVLPLGDKVLVELPEVQDKVGSIFIPDQAKEEKSEGTVRETGYGRISDSGQTIPLRVAIGDKVLFSKFAGDDIEVEGKKYKILKEVEILAIVRD